MIRSSRSISVSPAPLRTALVVILTTVGLSLSSWVAASPDPFYSSRLREGIAAAERGQHGEAVRSLRIACFGLLEEDVLAECLVRLGLSQAALADQEGFGQTFRRLVEADELLGIYARSEIDPALLEAYKSQVRTLVPPSIWRGTLDLDVAVPPGAVSAGTEGPGPAAARSPRDRRRELEGQLKSDPTSPHWPRELARLERELDRPRAALDAARRTLELVPADSDASCIAAWASARQRNCRSLLAYAANCTELEPRVRRSAAECAAELEDWTASRGWIEGLSEADQQDPAVVALADRIAIGLAAASPPPVASEVEAAPTSMAEPTAESTTEGSSPGEAAPAVEPEGETAEPVDLEAVLSGIRLELEGAEDVRVLNALFDRTEALLVRVGSDRDGHFLAAEIAYRASRWQDAVRHFEAAGDPGDGNPRLLFYQAIARYESGDRVGARESLERCIDRLSRSPFVERYRAAILGGD